MKKKMPIRGGWPWRSIGSNRARVSILVPLEIMMMETAHDATMLLVNVIRADGLPSTGADGTVDTYCELSLGSVVKTSSMKPDDRNPAFDEYFLLYVGEHTMLSLLSSLSSTSA